MGRRLRRCLCVVLCEAMWVFVNEMNYMVLRLGDEMDIGGYNILVGLDLNPLE